MTLKHQDDESGTFDATAVPSPVLASSCSTSSSSSTSSSGSRIADDEDSSVSTANASRAFVVSRRNLKFGDDETTLASFASSIRTPKPFTSMPTTTTRKSTKLSLGLDDLRHLARLGRSATLREKCRLPHYISTADIHVQVDIDEQATSRTSRKLEGMITEAIRDDLSAVYSADSESAKLFLCVVVVVMADGSILSTLSDKESVIGLVEIGLVWHLFDGDDLTVFNGGLVVKTEEVSTSLFDFITIPNRGRHCLLDRLVPRVTNEIMSRIAHGKEDLRMEV